MIKIIIVMKKRKGISREDFKNHYENCHAVLGRKYLGHLFERYVRNYPSSKLDIDDEGGETIDCVTEIWLKDAAALAQMQEIIAKPEIRAVFAADEKLFQDKAASRFLIVDEVEG